jgi:uncharacterized membrane protein YcaP (DUF421 family)
VILAAVAMQASIAPVTAHRVEVQAIKTMIVMVLLVVGFRVLGKREAAQLNLYDLAMLMALANAVQNAMTGGLGNLPVGLATSSTLLVGAWAFTRLVVRRPKLEARFVGTPVLLVHDGRVLPRQLRRNLVSPEELSEACRQHGILSPEQCAAAVLEVDGSISIVAGADASRSSGDAPDATQGGGDAPDATQGGGNAPEAGRPRRALMRARARIRRRKR